MTFHTDLVLIVISELLVLKELKLLGGTGP